MTAPRAAVTGWSPPLAPEAAARRAQSPDQKAWSARFDLRWGPAWEGAGDRKGRPQLSLGSAGKGPWEQLCALRLGLGATWPGAGLGKLWASGWGLPSLGHPAGAGGGGSRCLRVGLMRLKTTTVLSLSASGLHQGHRPTRRVSGVPLRHQLLGRPSWPCPNSMILQTAVCQIVLGWPG